MNIVIRVAVADDHPVLRTGLKALIGAQPDMQFAGEAGSGPDIVALAARERPDLILLDLTMPGPGFVQTIGELFHASPDTRILVLTMHDDPAYLRAALLAGARGYVVKLAPDSELVAAIRAVHEGRSFVDLGHHDDAPVSDEAWRRLHALSPRETEVLRLLAQGFTNQDIADRITLSVKTVETYRTRLYRKLEAKTRADLYRFAVIVGLLQQPGDDNDLKP